LFGRRQAWHFGNQKLPAGKGIGLRRVGAKKLGLRWRGSAARTGNEKEQERASNAPAGRHDGASIAGCASSLHQAGEAFKRWLGTRLPWTVAASVWTNLTTLPSSS
jgi:hypothetical protein